MRFFISSDIRKNTLLQIIISLTLVFFVFLWITNLLLYLEVGFNYQGVVEYYLGSEETFRPPKSYLGLLQEAHFHFFSMAIILVTLTHLILFTPVSNLWKLVLTLASYLSALGDIAGGWLILYISPDFAYFKIASVVVLQASLAIMMLLIVWYLFISRNKS